MQRVLGLGEDDQLAAIAGRVDHQIVVENTIELAPFRVHARAQYAERHRLQPLQGLDFQGELLDCLGRRRARRDQILKLVDLLLAILLDVPQHVGTDRGFRCAGPAALGGKARFTQLVFQPFATALEGLVDSGRRRGEPPLKDLQGETDIVALLPIALGKALHAVHLGAHVLGDSGIERGLPFRELILDRARPPLGEQRPTIELEQFLLGQPPHHVFGVGIVDTVAEPALEPIAIEERHEELEILFLAVVRRRRHQQQMAANLAELLADLIAPRIFDLAAEIGRRHAMGFIADDQVPFPRTHELLLKLLVARQHVETDDQPIPVAERIARPRVLDHVAGEDVELEIELLAEFVLPLLNQAARRNDEAAFQIAAGDQFLHQQPGHDGLAGAGIIGKEEAQRLARQHFAIDR